MAISFVPLTFSNGMPSGYALDENFKGVKAGLEDALSRVSAVDNEMQVDLDMNGQRILNLPEPVLPTEAARLEDVQAALSGAAANLITFTPYDFITSENVQGALEEVADSISALEDEKTTLYVDSVSDLNALDTSGFSVGQLVSVQGTVFRWDGSSFVRWISTTGEFVIYVDATSGSDLNDGLTTGTALKTLQAAVDYLYTFGPYLKGQFTIELAAGTYARGRFPEEGLPSEFPIIIRGPDVGGHPNVPTAIISEGATGVAAELIRFRKGTDLYLKDLKFIGADGTSSSAGASGGDQCRLFTENCHFDSCYWGVSVTNRSNLDVKGGIFESCGLLNGAISNGAGTRTLFNSRHAIGNQSAVDTSEGPWFQNCDTACFAQEGSTGHCDYARIEDCRRGLLANINSRFNYSGTRFRRNGLDVRANNAHVFETGADYGTGADASTIRVSTLNLGATFGVPFFTDQEVGTSSTPKRYITERLDTVINSLTPTPVHTSTLRGNFWNEPPNSTLMSKKLSFKVYGTLTGGTDTKVISARLGSGSSPVSLTFTSADTGKFVATGEVYFTDVTEQFISIEGFRHLSASPRMATSKLSVDMSLNQEFTIEAAVGNAADSVEISVVEVSASI